MKQAPYIKDCFVRISPLNFSHPHNQPAMYRLQLCLVPIHQQQPLGLPLQPPFVNPFTMQQPLVANPNIPWRDGSYSTPFGAGPVYQGMGQQNQNHQCQAPSSGPRRNHRRRFRKAEPQYKNHTTHESSGTVKVDRSTGTNSGNAWIGTSNNTRAGKVWRTPSKNPLMTDHNVT